MATRLQLRTTLRERLEDTSGAPLWTDAALNEFLASAVRAYGATFPKAATAATAALVAGNTGAALQVELQPLVQKVKRKRRGLASLYRKRNAMLLDLMERFGAAPIGGLRRTVPVWPPILPSDREAEARVGVQLVNAKVRSRRSVAADLGEEDPDGEITRIIEEAERLAGMAAAEAGGNGDDDEHGEEPEEEEERSEDEAGGSDPAKTGKDSEEEAGG